MSHGFGGMAQLCNAIPPSRLEMFDFYGTHTHTISNEKHLAQHHKVAQLYKCPITLFYEENVLCLFNGKKNFHVKG